MSNTSDNSVYVILVNDDNSMTVTQKKRIVQRSKLVDDLWFLVDPEYNGHSMSDFTVMLEYLSPVSRKYRTEFLTKSDDTYNGYLKYTLPIDTQITTEAGNVELQLTFIAVGLDANGKSAQHVRKITGTTINVVPISAWSDIIPDCALSALDQRIIKLDAQIRAMNDATNVACNKADDIIYNDANNELQLSSGGIPIGSKIVLKSSCDGHDDDIVDFDKNEGNDDNQPDIEDGNDIVEF